MKKVKIFFSGLKKPELNWISENSISFFKSRIKNWDFKTESWWTLEFFDKWNAYSILAHTWTKEIDFDELQCLWARAYKKAMALKWENNAEIKIIFESKFSKESRFFIEKWVLLAQIKNDTFKSKKKNFEIKLSWINNKKLITIVWAMDVARDLISTPSNICDPVYLENFCTKTFSDKKYWVKTTTFWKKDLQKENMNLFLAVNAGSKDEAKMVVMDYAPWKKDEQPLVLVWKWLTYDSWGYYMKPYPHMNDMWADMWWAWTVIAVMTALKEIWINKRVVWIIWITENMVDAESFKNWDIITSRAWKTVFIDHTDAEWRLVLADLLSYATDIYKPSYIFDYATLTWACHYSLWEMYTWIFTDSQKLIEKFKILWKETNDLVWDLPFDKNTKNAVKHKIADLVNGSNIKMLWASTAAAFLANFVKDTKKWIHFDIAWTAMRTAQKKDYDTVSWVWTGSMVHLTLEYLKKN